MNPRLLQVVTGDLRQAGLLAGVIAFLWYRVVDHLRIEWSVNPQYHYGWAVPLLCLYLLWRKGLDPPPTGLSAGVRPNPSSALNRVVLFIAALLYAPTRLIEEANPDWRLVSWALALEVIAITLATFSIVFDRLGGNFPPQRETIPATVRALALSRSWSALLSPSNLRFAVLFFLVAVPWPTFVEVPLIEGLTRGVSMASTELLNLVGVPAIRHGNVIEVGSGSVGIDEACSGIRSFQATLMISLFLGELYALTAPRRAFCVLAGFALSYLFNVGRTTLLCGLAARGGMGAMTGWHDPAGTAILVGCFLAVWWLARCLRGGNRRERGQRRVEEHIPGPDEMGSPCATAPRAPEPAFSKVAPHPTDEKPRASRDTPEGNAFSACLCVLRVLSRQSLRFPIVLAAWVILVEAGTEAWYRLHEWGTVKAQAWHVVPPRQIAGFQEIPRSERVSRILRYDAASNWTWFDAEGNRWQAIYLRWNPGRIASSLAHGHTPAGCVTASGRRMLSRRQPVGIVLQGSTLQFDWYVFEDAHGPLHVFHCVCEDFSRKTPPGSADQTRANRLRAVAEGRRNRGQRSIEVAVWGMDDMRVIPVLQGELEKMFLPGN